jgi:REP element-mobilizing transposase RayT
LIFSNTDCEPIFKPFCKEKAMPRIPRNLIKDENRCYHVISRTTGQEFKLGNLEKEHLMKRIKLLSSVYFVKVFTFSILSNHFHLLVQMRPGDDVSDEGIARRFRLRYGPKRPFPKEEAAHYRAKWSDLSEYVKEIKQGFAYWYNRRENRRGYFWSERFKSVVVEDGAALLSCMAYIDLNAVRANLVDRPEDYRYCGLGYHMGSGNKDRFLSTDISELAVQNESPLEAYRRYVYEVGRVEHPGSKRPIPRSVLQAAGKGDYRVSQALLFRYRSRYFTESVVLGSKDFVRGVYGNLRTFLKTKQERNPTRIKGLEGLYSLKRLSKEVV